MPITIHPSMDAPPGLTALVVYLRPAPRAELLTSLANLGIFVREQQQLPLCAGPRQADICLLVANARGDEEAAASLAMQFPSLVVCLPPGADTAPYEGSGARRCITDSQVHDLAMLAETAQHARSLRAGPVRLAPTRVFGDLDLHILPPTLQRDGAVVALSQSEKEVLRALAATLGRPVPLAELERCAAPGPVAHPGFLKAVVLRIRRKAAELGGDPELLRTVRGFGYVLIG